MLLGELEPFFNRPSSLSKQIRHICDACVHEREQSRSQNFVPLDQRSENESSRSIRFEITIGTNRILVIRFTAQSQTTFMACYGACLKWLLPELSFSIAGQGERSSGNEIGAQVNDAINYAQ